MDRTKTAQYFCSGCGAIRNEQTKRCVSCGRVFHDEVDSTETIFALKHPQTKVRYVRRSRVALFFDELLTFRSMIIILGSALVLWCIITFMPHVIGVKTDAIITKINTLHCKGENCQMQIFYEYTGIDSKVYNGMYHTSMSDTYFHPPVEGVPTPIRYIPYLPFIPPYSPNEWFPFGILMAGILGLGMVVYAARGQLQ
ncbi:MAG: hypothetical protein ACYCZF_02900 [Anaerolineae bacterium]